jgi:hypothetical protein
MLILQSISPARECEARQREDMHILCAYNFPKGFAGSRLDRRRKFSSLYRPSLSSKSCSLSTSAPSTNSHGRPDVSGSGLVATARQVAATRSIGIVGNSVVTPPSASGTSKGVSDVWMRINRTFVSAMKSTLAYESRVDRARTNAFGGAHWGEGALKPEHGVFRGCVLYRPIHWCKGRCVATIMSR